MTPDPAPGSAGVDRRTGVPPLITFGIPAYNRPQLLVETLASIAAQTAAVDYEVIVCDDGGLPETAAAVARFSADRFFYHRNLVRLGPVRNWNECLQRARGRWVMILHEDDLLYPWYLATVLPRLREGLAAVCTQVEAGPAPKTLASPAGHAAVLAYLPAYFIKSSMTPFPGVLFPRELGLHLGGFDERMGPLADYDFWYRLACAGRIEVVRTVGAFYRVTADQWTARAWPEMLRKTHLLRLRIARGQFRSRRTGGWLARFFTYRTALAYAARFPEKPATLARALQFRKILFSRLPSGWVWQCLKRLS
jgi:GT2 family glycosyltransferase